MSSPLSQDELDTIRKQLEATTPGEWRVPGANIFRVVSFNKVTKAVGGESWDWYKGIFEYPEHFFGGIHDIAIKDSQELANNAMWIASSKSHVSRLLDEVERLQAENKSLKAIIDNATG